VTPTSLYHPDEPLLTDAPSRHQLRGRAEPIAAIDGIFQASPPVTYNLTGYSSRRRREPETSFSPSLTNTTPIVRDISTAEGLDWSIHVCCEPSYMELLASSRHILAGSSGELAQRQINGIVTQGVRLSSLLV